MGRPHEDASKASHLQLVPWVEAVGPTWRFMGLSNWRYNPTYNWGNPYNRKPRTLNNPRGSKVVIWEPLWALSIYYIATWTLWEWPGLGYEPKSKHAEEGLLNAFQLSKRPPKHMKECLFTNPKGSMQVYGMGSHITYFKAQVYPI